MTNNNGQVVLSVTKQFHKLRDFVQCVTKRFHKPLVTKNNVNFVLCVTKSTSDQRIIDYFPMCNTVESILLYTDEM